MFRALPCYTPKQAGERCKSITIQELSARIKPHDQSAINLLAQFKKLIAQTEAKAQCAHLIEWDDGLMVLIVSPRARNPGELTCYTLAAAYSHAVKSGEFFYYDFAELPPTAPNGQDLSAALDRYIYVAHTDFVVDSELLLAVPISHLRYAIASCFRYWLKHPNRKEIGLADFAGKDAPQKLSEYSNKEIKSPIFGSVLISSWPHKSLHP